MIAVTAVVAALASPTVAADRVEPGDSLAELSRDASETLPKNSTPTRPMDFLRTVVSWTALSLAVVLGGVLLLRRFVARRSVPGGTLVEVLGRTSLSARHSVIVLRIAGERLLVVGVSTDRITTLLEMRDDGAIGHPDEKSDGAAREDNERLEAVDLADGRDSRSFPELGRLRGALKDWGRVFPNVEGNRE